MSGELLHFPEQPAIIEQDQNYAMYRLEELLKQEALIFEAVQEPGLSDKDFDLLQEQHIEIIREFDPLMERATNEGWLNPPSEAEEIAV